MQTIDTGNKRFGTVLNSENIAKNVKQLTVAFIDITHIVQ